MEPIIYYRTLRDNTRIIGYMKLKAEKGVKQNLTTKVIGTT